MVSESSGQSLPAIRWSAPSWPIRIVVSVGEPAASAASRIFNACSANRLTLGLSEREILIIGAAEPLGDQSGFIAAFDVDGGEPGQLDASVDIFNRLQSKSAADAGAGR